MADNKEILIEKLQRKVRKLEATLKIVANHSGKTESRMQKEFEVISETIPVPMIISNENSEIVFANLNAQKTFNYTSKNFIGLNISFLYIDPKDRKTFFKALSKTGEISDFRAELKKSGESAFPAAIFSRKINFDGQDCVLSIVHDLTNIMKLEEQLRQSHKMESIGTLAGGIAHDFNNILGIILGYSEILKIQLPDDFSATGSVDQIMKAGNRAKDLVTQILAFSRTSDDEFRPIMPHLIINEVLKMLRASIPSTIEIRGKITKCGAIIGEPTQLHQVVMNLCTNAYHAMRETGGVLEVLLEPIVLNETDTQVLSLALPPGTYAKLEIRDTGHGIDKALQLKIFDPYFTTKKKGDGTGLGLAVVHSAVQSFSGHIAVYSEPERGTTFRVYFPLIELRVKPAFNEDIDPVPRGDEHILVVDDEASIVEILKEMLEGFGYQVSAFTSSTEALKEFENRIDDIDLVITDMTMPEMTGVELIQNLCTLKPGLPSILCSGFSELVNKKSAKEFGIDKYLMKPVLNRDLAIAVRDILDI